MTKFIGVQITADVLQSQKLDIVICTVIFKSIDLPFSLEHKSEAFLACYTNDIK